MVMVRTNWKAKYASATGLERLTFKVAAVLRSVGDRNIKSDSTEQGALRFSTGCAMPTRHNLPVVKQAKWHVEGLKASWLGVKQGKPPPKRLGGDSIARHKRLIERLYHEPQLILESTEVLCRR